MEQHVRILEMVAQMLGQANVALPIIFGAVAGISGIIRGVTGTGPALSDLADIIESQLDQNDAKLRADIASYRETLGRPS